MRVYVAAPNELLELARTVAGDLERAGIQVTSRWLNGLDTRCDASASVDLEDVSSADILLLINPIGWELRGSGGRHVEFGYALALRKKVLVVGVRSHIFHHLNHVRVVPWGSDVAKECLCLL